MINLEEEARKRRERLKSSFSTTKPSEQSQSQSQQKPEEEDLKAEKFVEQEEASNDFKVPEGEILLDDTGAEILGLDSKLPDTLEAQVKVLLSNQNDLIYHQQKEFDLSEFKERNSDLKREYEKRMSGLNRITKRAVVDIVRARLEKEAALENGDEDK